MSRQLRFDRPIVFFDLETTGTDKKKDHIVEICMIKLSPDGDMEKKYTKINPLVPIAKGATEVHGISDEDVMDAPTFKQLHKGIYEFIKGCDLAGFNINRFDIPLLYNEFERVGFYWDHRQHRSIDAGTIFMLQNPRNLTAAVKRYTGKDHDDAHSAEADVEATMQVLFAQIAEHEDVPDNVDEIDLLCNYGKPRLDANQIFGYNGDGDIIVNIGEHRGQPAKEHLDFLNWMIYKGTFPRDTINIANEIIGQHSMPF